MRKLTGMLGRSHHATGETSGTARVGIREHGHDIIGKSVNVERTPIVDDKHVKIIGKRSTLSSNAIFNQGNVGDDVLLIFECSSAKGNANVIDSRRINAGRERTRKDINSRSPLRNN